MQIASLTKIMTCFTCITLADAMDLKLEKLSFKVSSIAAN